MMHWTDTAKGPCDIAPHADVRIVIAELHKLESGLAAMGLQAPALTEAREMLTSMSFRINAEAKGVHHV